MANFTIRVELHGADPAHYEILHAHMSANGFNRFVSGVTQTGEQGFWRLPSAEYDHTSDRSAFDVRDAVKLIADSIAPGAWVLVTESTNRAWSTEKLPS